MCFHNKWDEYFLNICNTIATNSKCLSRQIGAIIVKDKSIISTGYNGPPRGVPHCGERYLLDKEYINELNNIKLPIGISYDENIDTLKTTCPRYVLGYKSGEGLDLCIAGHAERNALINAARNGIAVKGTTIYMNCPIPCKDCLIEIINAGISEIVVTEQSFYDETSKYILDNLTTNLIVRTFKI